jgi:hypothetical protein
MTRQEISQNVVGYGALLSGLSAWAVVYCMPLTLGDVICRAGRLPSDGVMGLPGLTLSWLAMMAAMTAPAAFLARAANRERPVVGRSATVSSVPLFLAISAVGAFSEWVLRSAGLVDVGGRFIAPLFAPAVLAGAMLILLRGLSRNRAVCRMACCVAMVLLQLAGGATNMVWMAALSTWMALESVFPWRRELAAFGAVTLCFAASFSLLQGSG